MGLWNYYFILLLFLGLSVGLTHPLEHKWTDPGAGGRPGPNVCSLQAQEDSRALCDINLLPNHSGPLLPIKFESLSFLLLLSLGGS